MHNQVEVLKVEVDVRVGAGGRVGHRARGLSRGDGKCGISYKWNKNLESFLYNCDTKDIKLVEILSKNQFQINNLFFKAKGRDR